MKRILGLGLVVVLGVSLTPAHAADDAKEIVNKAIAATGGEAKLGAAKVMAWKADTKVTIEGSDHDLTVSSMTQGLDHIRTTVAGEINGNDFKATTVVDGKKGWRTFPETNELDPDALEAEKRIIYLQVIATTLVAILSKDFKVEAAGTEKISDKPANVVKVTGPDGKTCRMMFDQTSGLLVRTVATVVGFGGDDYEQTSTFKDYKEMGGIQKATKIEVLRDGNPFLNTTIKEFQTMDTAPAGSFAEPK